MTLRSSRTAKLRFFAQSILCLTILLCLLSAVCLSAAADGWLHGDSDGDGEIGSADVTMIQRVIAGICEDTDGMISARGEVTGDELTLLDATEIQRYLAGLKCSDAVGKPAGSAPEQPTSGFCFPTEDNQLPIFK